MRFSIQCRKTKPKVITRANQKENTFVNQITAQSAGRKRVGDQDVNGFSFTSDWSRGWSEFFGPITDQSKAKPVQFRIAFDTNLKTTPIINLNLILFSFKVYLSLTHFHPKKRAII